LPNHPLKQASEPPETGYTFDIPAAPDAPALDGQAKADIAVIGAGLTGLSAALHAAEAGASVAVLEANCIGWGASGRSFAQVVPYLRHEVDVTRAALGPEAADRLIDTAARAPAVVFDLIRRHGIACDATDNGLIFAAHTPDQLAKLGRRAEFWAGRGAPVKLLDAAAVAAEVGGGSYWGGLIEGRGGTVNPLALCRGLARAAIAAGASVHEASHVRSLAREGGTWRLMTAGGAVRASAVMLCTDSYTDLLWPGLRRRMVYVRGHQIISAPLPEENWQAILPSGRPMTDTRRLISGIRKHRNRRIQMSSAISLSGWEKDPGHAAADRRLSKLFPFLGPVRWERSWSCWIGMTRDQFPRLAEAAPGLFVAYGYSGRGMALSIVMGRELARRAAEESMAEGPFPGELSKTIPLAPAAMIGVAGLLKCYRILDWVDGLRFGRGA